MLRRLLGVLLILLSSGCSLSSEPQTVTFWVMGREGEVISELLPAFLQRNPDVRVRLQQLPWSAAHEKLLTAFAGETLPDLCQLGNTWIPEFAALNALADLDALAARSTVVNRSDYFPGIWETNVIGGRLKGVPWYVDTRLLFYRRDLLERAGVRQFPRTWAEWEQALAAVKRNAGPDRYAILLPINEFEPLLALALQQDDPLLKDGGRWANFASPGFRRALELYAAMFRNGWAPLVGAAQISNVWTEFGRGLFAFYISGPWNIEEFKRRLPADRQNDWMTAPLPGPDGPGYSTAGGSSLVLFRASRHQAAAWRLIEYLSESAVQVQFHALSGNLPPRRAAWQDPRLAGDIYARAFREQLERTRPAPAVPEWERIATEMQSTAEQVVRGNLSVDEAIRALDARVNAMLEKRRWMLARGGVS
ncbi:MAG TPA: sugar ABC transporter substrate-binding protein [Candidatus Baltobacteraceae bacterium]|nr:sugar ABC transporter substrate-binding protein [Candidatus Baltobacteraceae bacterium]